MGNAKSSAEGGFSIDPVIAWGNHDTNKKLPARYPRIRDSSIPI